MIGIYLCTMFDFNRLFKVYSSKSGSKPSVFHGPQIKLVNVVVTVFQGWLPCLDELTEYRKQHSSEEPMDWITNHDFFQT